MLSSISARRIFLAVVTVACTAAHSQTIPELTRIDFLRPGDFSESSGVSFAVQMPENSMMLYDKPGNSNINYTAMATRPDSDGVNRIWYLRVIGRPANETPQPSDIALCLSEIRNNLWNPVVTNLPNSPCRDGGVNNGVQNRLNVANPINPQQIVSDPNGGLLRLYFGLSTGAVGLLRATSSAPGNSWTYVPYRVFSEPNDAFSAIRVGSVFRVYQTGLQPWPGKNPDDNLADLKRVIVLRTSNDSTNWTAQDLVSPMLQPDTLDGDRAEFYALKVFTYGSGYAGLLWKYYANPVTPGEHSNIFKYELITGGDGVQWERPSRDLDTGLFSYSDPIKYAARLSFPATSSEDLVLRGWPDGRMMAVVGNGGTFRTKPFYFPSTGMFVNVNTGDVGWVDVTVCDKDGTPIAGWSTYRITNSNEFKAPLPWVAGHEPVSLRFSLGGGAKLYGFGAN